LDEVIPGLKDSIHRELEVNDVTDDNP